MTQGGTSPFLRKAAMKMRSLTVMSVCCRSVALVLTRDEFERVSNPLLSEYALDTRNRFRYQTERLLNKDYRLASPRLGCFRKPLFPWLRAACWQLVALVTSQAAAK